MERSILAAAQYAQSAVRSPQRNQYDSGVYYMNSRMFYSILAERESWEASGEHRYKTTI